MSESTAQQHLPTRGDAQQPPPLTGTRAVRDALGPDAEKALDTHRATGGAVGDLAAAVQEAAGEADRLHIELRDHMDDVRQQLPDLAEADFGFLDLLQHTGTQLAALAARCDQQWSELDRLLGYLCRALARPTGPS
ncbi:hypothetical protein ACQEU8_33210 [Streptomyces sp. CA-250714]|uniref:hypothetical protein n=1 Tax=Streptomyces sp. CA-250714 TaxID=3240060 RepID=UPI003D91A4B7